MEDVFLLMLNSASVNSFFFSCLLLLNTTIVFVFRVTLIEGFYVEETRDMSEWLVPRPFLP